MHLPYRLIALDVDGTLLNDDHELTPGTKEAVQQACESGASIVLCTGRGPSNTFYLLEELGLEGILITHNGAVTLQSKDRNLLHSFAFELKEAESLLDYCRSRGIHYDVNTVFDMFIDRQTPDIQAMYDKFGVKPIRIEDVQTLNDPILKFTTFGPAEAIDQLERDWRDIGCKLNPLRSGAEFIDVMNPKATKGNALRQLARTMGIPREQVLAIGNYFNDIDMLEFAGRGIAMDNSPHKVKAAADEVTLANNNEGVRAALLRHVLV